jgi:hypothetical protein
MKNLELSWEKPAKKPRKSKVPLCAACGRKLRKYGKDSRQNEQLAAHSIRVSMTVKELIAKGPPDAGNLTADGLPPDRGACGHMLAVRLIVALGPEVLQLLPPEWKHR